MLLEWLGYQLSLHRKAAPPLAPAASGRAAGRWYPIIQEPYTGAWQQNQEIRADTALSSRAVFACVTLIAADVAKLRLRLVEVDDEGVWHETTNPAYSPVLRKPNRYQTTGKFVEQWITSKLVHGNTYVLKERDARGVVSALYVLDPTKVWPLIAPDGSVYYELRHRTAGTVNLYDATLTDVGGDVAPVPGTVTVPASEIIHDLMVPLFHPLVGVTPLYACGLAAAQGLTIQEQSQLFFLNGSKAGGVLTVPGAISDETADRLKTNWEANFTGPNIGRIAILPDGMKYEPMTVTPTDAKLIEQLNWTAETVCSCFHVPAYMIGVGPMPSFRSIEPLLQQYHAQCIQALLAAFEAALDEGLGIDGTSYGTEFDVDDLIWLDTATKTQAAADAIGSGAVSPNEARKKWFGLGSVEGGDTPYMQQQNYALSDLAKRSGQADPFSTAPAPAPAALPAPAEPAPAALPPAEPAPAVAAARWSTVALALLQKDWTAIADGV